MIKIPSNIFTRLFYSPKSRFIIWAKSPQNRYALYKAMSESSNVFLCDKFADATGYSRFNKFSFTSVIYSLPELENICSNHPKFDSFNVSFWFRTNSSKQDVKIRTEILQKAIEATLVYE